MRPDLAFLSETGMKYQKYQAAAQAAKRIERTAVKDPKRKMFLEQLKRRLSTVRRDPIAALSS
jgi:hypothetical protein